jgi:hypothetical protein
MLAVIFFVTFYAFRSTTLIGDGLRHLPALRTIIQGATPTYQAKPWLEVYRDHYDKLAVHNHFLFGVTMRAAFALQQKLGIKGDAIIAMEAVNALSASIAGALFYLLAFRIGLSNGYSVALALGLCLSPTYLLAATNVAEVALPLPFFIATLLLLTDRRFIGWMPIAAGVSAGLAAIFYLIAGALVPCVAVAIIATQFRSQWSAMKSALRFLCAFGLVFCGIWMTVLMASGYRTPGRLVRAIMVAPGQGTYGGFKFGSLVATPVGLTQAFIKVLPDDFLGLRSLYQNFTSAFLVGAATLLVCAFLAWVTYTLFRQEKSRDLLTLASFLTFLLVEGACIEWDPYYQKLQLFALILCWVMAAVAFSHPQSGPRKWPLLVFVTIVVANGAWVLKDNVKASEPRMNAERLNSIIGNGVLITGWSADVAHLWLYSDGNDVIPLPDFALNRGLNSMHVKEDLDTIINRTVSQGRNVYFYGLFDENSGEPSDVYEDRFRLSGFTDYLRNLEHKAHPIERLPQPGGHSSVLYVYTP